MPIAPGQADDRKLEFDLSAKWLNVFHFPAVKVSYHKGILVAKQTIDLKGIKILVTQM